MAGRLVKDALFQWAGLPTGGASGFGAYGSKGDGRDGGGADDADSEVLVDANPIFFDPESFSPQRSEFAALRKRSANSQFLVCP